MEQTEQRVVQLLTAKDNGGKDVQQLKAEVALRDWLCPMLPCYENAANIRLTAKVKQIRICELERRFGHDVSHSFQPVCGPRRLKAKRAKRQSRVKE